MKFFSSEYTLVISPARLMDDLKRIGDH